MFHSRRDGCDSGVSDVSFCGYDIPAGEGDTSPESRTARAKVEEIDNLIEQEYLFDTDGDDLSQECMQALWTDLGISIPAIIQRKSMRPCSRAMRTLRRHRRRDDAG